jgi:putative ABC transport system permease protein
MDTLRADIRHALTTLARHPGFAAAGLLTLALGIGATTAVFSVVYGVLLRPLPYPNAERLVRLSEERTGAAVATRGPILTNFTYHAWMESPQTLEGLAAVSQRQFTVGSETGPVRMDGAVATPSLFRVLGVTPALGRFFADEEARQIPEPVVVLSDPLWRERFGADAGVVGSAWVIDGRPHTIVGVARPGFSYPDRGVRFWTPYSVPRPSGNPMNVFVAAIEAVGLMKEGATPAQVEAEGSAAATNGAPPSLSRDTIFGAGGPPSVRARTLVDDMTAAIRPALLVLAGSVVFLLLITCANVANLFLSRGIARQRELAVRAAIGATGWRLGRQLLTESAVLSALGAAAGVALAWVLVRVIPSVAPANFPRLDDIRLDGRALGVAAGLAVFTALASGLPPAIRGARFNLFESLHGGDGATAGGFRGTRAGRLRDLLLVAEAAFAVVLLVGATLLAHSFQRLMAVDAGYTATRVLTARVHAPGPLRDAVDARRTRLTLELLERLRATPGIVAAGAGSMLPLDRTTMIAAFPLNVVGAPAPEKPTMARALRNLVTPGYAEALGLRLRAGRFLNESDQGSTNLRVMVNEEFARLYLPPDPIGLQLAWNNPPIAEIVGVVGNVLKDGNDRQPQAEMYAVITPETRTGGAMGIVLRSEGNPAALTPLFREVVREVDPEAAIDVAPLAERLAASVAQPRFALSVLATFAVLALVLASIGLYGVLSYAVSQRWRELGVRAALGADRTALVRLVLRHGLTVTVVGLVLGLGAAAALTRVMQGLLFGITPLDGVAFATPPMLLVPVALVACLVPARRAAGVSPSEALRCE